MAYYDLEFRVKLFDFTSYRLPGTVGLIAFNDIGRVWVLIFLQETIGFLKEGVIPYIAIGYRFQSL